MRRCLRFWVYALPAFVAALFFSAVYADASGLTGAAGTLIGLSNDEVYQLLDEPRFVESGKDNLIFNFEEWAAYSLQNPTEQGRDGIIAVRNQVIIRYYIGYTPDYSGGRFTPGFIVSHYRAEADKYIRLEDLPAYCADVAGISHAEAVYMRPVVVSNPGFEAAGSVISYVLASDSLTNYFGSTYSDKRLVVQVTVLDGEVLGYPGERLVDSYSVGVLDGKDLEKLGERVNQ